MSLVAFLAFALLAIVGPGLALQRAVRVRPDPALVLPLGFTFCAGAYWTGLRTHAWLFPALVLAADLALLRLGVRPVAPGPSLRGALPAAALIVAVLALTEYGGNRVGPEGDFLADPVLPEDAAFHVGLAHELALGYPPQVPGLSGFPLGYHFGLPLVRAAALRWAGVAPFDSLSRFDVTLGALALVLALRASVGLLGGGRLAAALVGLALVATDPSFLLGWGRPNVEWWIALTEGSFFFFSLLHANSGVIAIAMALASLAALRRALDGEGRGWLGLAALLAAAVPFFKVFAAAQLLLGLGLAAAFSRTRAGSLVAALPAAAVTAALVLGPGGRTVDVAVDPLLVVRDTLEDVGLGRPAGPVLLLWTLPWCVLSLGLRLAGLGEASEALRSRAAPAMALAAMALSGWPLGLVFRISPEDPGARARPFNEGLYFFEQSGLLLWIFVAVALGSRRWRPGVAALAALGCAALALPSTVQFVWHKRELAPQAIPAAVVRAMAFLERETAPGEVVLMRPDTQRYAPPPILVGRRVPYTRFIPYLSQFAPREERLRRFERAMTFFTTTDGALAREVARELGARYVCLFRAERVRFEAEGVLESVYEEPGIRVYRIRE